MADAKNITNSRTQNWTTEQLVNLSADLAHAYCLGLNKPDLVASKSQNWTTEQLVNLSANLARAYCPGL